MSPDGWRTGGLSAGLLAVAWSLSTACARSDNTGVDAGVTDATRGGDTTVPNDASGLDAAGNEDAGRDADAAGDVAVTDATPQGDACPPGLGDCDENPTTSCETNTTNDVSNCGACGRACSTINVAAQICSGGVCTSTCAVGAGNCSQPAAPIPDDGCETQTATNNGDCGGCGNSCSNPMFGANPTCTEGAGTQRFCGCTTTLQCEFGSHTAPTCSAGLCTCNATICQRGEACADPSATDGATGDVCSCYGGAACSTGQTCCQIPLGCHDLLTDPQNCAACGHACAPGFVCTLGVCTCGTAASCNGGAMAGAFSCMDGVCSCDDNTCEGGQRCLADGGCG